MNEDAKEPRGVLTIDKNMICRYGLKAATFYAEAKRQKEKREKTEEVRPDGFFPLTLDAIKREIGLGRHEQESAIQELSGAGVLRAKALGLPARRHICLDK